jgi:hypothetical protein
MSGTIPGLDEDGKFVLHVDPKHIEVDEQGNLKVNHPKMKEFLKNHKMGTDSHIILMGSNCGCQCCC